MFAKISEEQSFTTIACFRWFSELTFTCCLKRGRLGLGVSVWVETKSELACFQLLNSAFTKYLNSDVRVKLIVTYSFSSSILIQVCLLQCCKPSLFLTCFQKEMGFDGFDEWKVTRDSLPHNKMQTLTSYC